MKLKSWKCLNICRYFVSVVESFRVITFGGYFFLFRFNKASASGNLLRSLREIGWFLKDKLWIDEIKWSALILKHIFPHQVGTQQREIEHDSHPTEWSYLNV